MVQQTLEQIAQKTMDLAKNAYAAEPHTVAWELLYTYKPLIELATTLKHHHLAATFFEQMRPYLVIANERKESYGADGDSLLAFYASFVSAIPYSVARGNLGIPSVILGILSESGVLQVVGPKLVSASSYYRFAEYMKGKRFVFKLQQRLARGSKMSAPLKDFVRRDLEDLVAEGLVVIVPGTERSQRKLYVYSIQNETELIRRFDTRLDKSPVDTHRYGMADFLNEFGGTPATFRAIVSSGFVMTYSGVGGTGRKRVTAESLESFRVFISGKRIFSVRYFTQQFGTELKRVQNLLSQGVLEGLLNQKVLVMHGDGQSRNRHFYTYGVENEHLIIEALRSGSAGEIAVSTPTGNVSLEMLISQIGIEPNVFTDARKTLNIPVIFEEVAKVLIPVVSREHADALRQHFRNAQYNVRNL